MYCSVTVCNLGLWFVRGCYNIGILPVFEVLIDLKFEALLAGFFVVLDFG